MKRNLLAFVLMISVTAMGGENAALPLPATGNVTLPIAEYNKLLDLAAKPPKKPEVPPLPYTLQSADLKFRVGEESVLGTVQLDGEVLSKTLTKVPLATGMTIMDAHQQSKALPLEQEGETSTAILPGSSEFSVTLDAGLPLDIEAGRASFNLPVPAAGSVRLSLVIPGDHSNVRITPGLITGRTSLNGQTTIEAALAPGEPANISWTTREIVAPPAPPKEVRFLSDLKTLVSVNEAEIRAAILADITVVQGEPQQFSLLLPAGYEVTGTSGASVLSSTVRDGVLTVWVSQAGSRNHELFITLEKSISATKADAPFVSFKDSQRETGQVLVEGTGAMELSAKESGGLKRLDVKEVDLVLRSLSRFPLQAAFRYHRQPGETPALALEWVRFPDNPVLAAVAERAIVTTLVTSEGRSLTEVKLLLRNQAQPFLKVDLPPGVNILSADVAGEKVKPVQGADGSRVPLLRPGFRPTEAYYVSFVFMHSGAPFATKGGSELNLPKMDVPINLLQWEVFLPEQFKVKNFSGDAIATTLLPPALRQALDAEEVPPANAVEVYAFLNNALGLSFNSPGLNFNNLQHLNSANYNVTIGGTNSNNSQQTDWQNDNGNLDQLALMVPGAVGSPGQLSGTVTDPQGAVVPGAHVKVTRVDNGSIVSSTSNGEGYWKVSGLSSGKMKVEVTAPGFKATVYRFAYDANKPAGIVARLDVGGTSETVEVTSVNSSPIGITDMEAMGPIDRKAEAKKNQQAQQNAASSNVYNLQKRVAGVLPVRVDVPRAGTSYHFVRPLVLDEETQVTFTYKSR